MKVNLTKKGKVVVGILAILIILLIIKIGSCTLGGNNKVYGRWHIDEDGQYMDVILNSDGTGVMRAPAFYDEFDYTLSNDRIRIEYRNSGNVDSFGYKVKGKKMTLTNGGRYIELNKIQ